MKVAMIVPFPIFPPDDGGRVRPYNLLKEISRNHEAMLFTPKSPTNAACDIAIRVYETTAPGRGRQILDQGFVQLALRIAREERPDVIVSEFPWPGLHAAYVARRLGVPMVLDAPNVEGDRFRSTGARAWPLVAAYEQIVARLAKRIFVVSADDRARFARKNVSASKIQVVPNGVDPEALHPDPDTRSAVRRALGVADETRVVLFFGQLGYPPNRDAVHVIERVLVPRLARGPSNVVFVVAGKNAGTAPAGRDSKPNTRDAAVRFVGAVPDIAAYINAADVVAVPVRSGGGTRLKVLESIACGTPVVSTTIGAEGIDASACGDLLTVVDGWDAFADALARPHVKSGNVPTAFLDMYSWASIVSRIEWPA